MIWIVLAAIGGVILGGLLMYLSTVRGDTFPSLSKFVIFSIAVLIVYTVAELVLSTVTGVSHDTLTTCIFSCFGGEILSCAIIKVFKLKEEEKDE